MELASALHDLERLPGRERGGSAPGRQGGAFPAGGFLAEQGPENLGRFPALRPGGGDHLRCVPADVGQPQPPQQRLEVIRQRWRCRDTRRGRDGRRRGGPGRRAGHAVTSPSAVPSAAQPAVPWASEWSSPARRSWPVRVRAW